MAIENTELFDVVMPDAVNWVGEQFFIDQWVEKPNDDTLASYDITKTIRNYGTKWEELTNCETVEEAKASVIRDIVSDILDELGIESAGGLEKVLIAIDDEGDIEGSMQSLGAYAPFEMLENHEVSEMTHEEALVENALATAEGNTEEESEDELEADDEDEEPNEIEEAEEVKEAEEPKQEVAAERTVEEAEIPDEIDMSEMVSDRKEAIAAFQVEEKVEVKAQGVPWEFIAKFWNEDLDLLKIVKEEKVAQTLLDRLTSLQEDGMLTSKREMIDALFLLLNGYPPAVAEIIELFDGLD